MERTKDGTELQPNNFVLELNDAEGSSNETGAYADDKAALGDTDVSADPVQTDANATIEAGVEEPVGTGTDAAA